MSWRQVALREVGQIVGGGTPKTSVSENFGDDYAWITPKDLSLQKSRYVSRGARNISTQGLMSSSAKLLPAGTVLMSSRAPIGLTAIAAQPVTTNQGCRSFIPGPGVDSLFMYYLLGSMKPEFERRANGSTFKEISGSTLAEIEISLPSFLEQRTISATLGALDDKIESNRRVIELIPSLVRARVDMAITNESVVVPVSDLASFTNGGAYTKGATGTGRMVIRIAELNSGPGGSTVYNDIQVPDAKTARAGDLLMAWSGSLGVYRWYRDESIINQHIFKVVPDEYPAWLVFDRLEAVMPVFRALAADKATTMGHIQKGHLTSTTVSVPTGAAIAQLDEELAPLWERLLLAERENLRLSRLRDTLLPELLSGRLRVPAEVS